MILLIPTDVTRIVSHVPLPFRFMTDVITFKTRELRELRELRGLREL